MSDPLFGLHATALQLHSRRMELISSNLANADTPGYRARDIDFKSALAAAADAQPRAGRAEVATPVRELPLQFRAAMPSLDGNGVDMAREQAAFADAALRYEASLRFIEGRLGSLMTAITGQ